MASTLNASTTGGLVATADTSGVLQLQTGNTTAVTVDASQNVGVGTAGTLNYNSKFKVYQSANGSAAEIYTGGSNYTSKLNLTNDFSGAAIGSVQGNLVFYASDATVERMRIDSSGVFMVGTNVAGGSGGISVFPQGNGANTAAVVVWNATSTSNVPAVFRYNGTGVGSITYNGTSTTYNTTSDYRLKENIQPMVGALSTVAKLKPVTYDWISDKSKGQGFIAHELQEIVPDCVTGEKDAVNEDGSIKPQSIDTSFLVATLTAAIQELTARVAALEAK